MNIKATNGIMIVYKLKGVNNENNQYFVVYPNPSNGEINFNFEVRQKGFVKLYITDINGKVETNILEKEMETGKYTFSDNIENLTSGVYLASYTNNNNKATAKIVKN